MKSNASTSDIAKMATERLKAVVEEIKTTETNLTNLHIEEKKLRAMVEAYNDIDTRDKKMVIPSGKISDQTIKKAESVLDKEYSRLGKFTKHLLQKGNAPLLTSEITKAYSTFMGKEYSKDGIGVSLSSQYKIGEMRAIQINDLPNGLRNWIVMETWLNNDKTLKIEYLNKIKSRIAA